MVPESAGLSIEACRREIEALHDFFAAWYTDRDVDFSRLEASLAEGFELVSPEGEVLDRQTVLEAVRDSQGQYFDGGFDIEIRDVSLVDSTPKRAVARYEEWQSTPNDETGRVSTVVFRADDDAPGGLRWLAVQETWLDGPSSD